MKLMCLSGSLQELDVRAGKAPSDVFDGVARVKTYVKMQDVEWGASPLDYEFDQPYQVVAHRLGCTWNEANAVVVFQAAGCNLACDYCFVGEDHEAIEVDAGEMVEVYNRYRAVVEAAGGCPSRVVRISGGEPFLQQEALVDVIRADWPDDVFLWVDTNLTQLPQPELVFALQQGPAGNDPKRIAVCGCFKPESNLLNDQRRVARRLIRYGVECFFYWPCALSLPLDVEDPDPNRWFSRGQDACEFLETVHENAPLRTTFLLIKYHYNTQRGLPWDIELLDDCAARVCWEMRMAQTKFVKSHYAPTLYWQPSHMIPLEV